MANKYKDRIKILENHEIEELYGLLKFNADERAYYFSLTQKEQEIAQSHRTQENRVLFILQIGYFKAKTMFFRLCLTKFITTYSMFYDNISHCLVIFV